MSVENRYQRHEDIPCPRLQPKEFASYLELRQRQVQELGEVATLSLVAEENEEEFKQMAEFDMRPAMAI